MSKLVSLRLPDDVAEWIESYRQERGWSRAELIGQALSSFRRDCEGGVPDLPPAPRVADSELAASRAEHARNIAARQRLLNDAKVRASR